MAKDEKVGYCDYVAEPFHCDFHNRLSMGHLGNHMLNTADLHSRERGFGMDYLFTINRAWVLSRLAIEVDEMPASYDRFTIETWVESVMRFFTNRNFTVRDIASGKEIAHARSVWALIDTETRQPTDILSVNDGAIMQYVEKEKPCPMEKATRVKMSDNAEFVRSIDTNYSDVDMNGHINSVKYLEHVLNLWSTDWYKEHQLKRIEMAYVSESHGGDRLSFYREHPDENTFLVKILKEDNTEVVRSKVTFGAIQPKL